MRGLGLSAESCRLSWRDASVRIVEILDCCVLAIWRDRDGVSRLSLMRKEVARVLTTPVTDSLLAGWQSFCNPLFQYCPGRLQAAGKMAGHGLASESCRLSWRDASVRIVDFWIVECWLGQS